ncbi:thiamine diphosphate-binding protein [Mycena sp. CBHHK59/15]|nr:thiamine diphosphate-binding protein [Mycena sp. CBHHK59/15]
MKSVGFHVIEVYDGTNNLHAVVAAPEGANKTKGKPTFVHVRTTIGLGGRKANTGSAHGATLGEDEVEYVKTSFGLDPKAKFAIPEEVYSESYGALPTVPQATRKSSSIAESALFPKYSHFMVGSVDLMESTFVHWKGQIEFQSPETGLGDFSGCQIRHGIRQYAMIGISNGMNAYQNGMVIPYVISSRWSIDLSYVWLYTASAVRMTALQALCFLGTHDSIGVGEDGPTHQSIVLGTFFHALINMNLIRPADAEVIGAWEVALDVSHTPSIFAFTSQEVPRDADPDLVIIATGSEVYRAIEAAKLLASSLRVRVASMPSQSHFDNQPAAYRRSVLATGKALAIAIDRGMGQLRVGEGRPRVVRHTHTRSECEAKLFDLFGFGVDTIAQKIGAFAESKRVDGQIVLPEVGEFEDSLLGFAKQHAGPYYLVYYILPFTYI